MTHSSSKFCCACTILLINLGATSAALADGACCLRDGSCTVTSSIDCTIQGGSFQRDLTDCCSPNIPCRDADCGACCLSDGACAHGSFAFCEGLDGSYQGDGTVCDTGNICSACCRPDSCDMRIAERCASTSFLVPGGVCGLGTCPSYRPCCSSSGLCYDDFTTRCVDNGGGILVNGTVCQLPFPGPTPCGACCFENGSCLHMTAEDCHAAGGLLSDTLCDEGFTCSVGACCVPWGGCFNMREAECAENEGAFQGHWNQCYLDVACGACCVDSSCTLSSADDCSGPFYEKATCGPNTCPQPSACCHDDGTCTEELPEGCQAPGDTYIPDTPCGPEACWGACCTCDMACSMSDRDQCEARGDRFAGVGETCADNPCQVPFGACCQRDGDCHYPLPETTCTGVRNFYQGDCSTCDDCVAGACCLSTGICQVIHPDACTQEIGGQYLGDGTTCADTTCEAGACCLCDGRCLFGRSGACENAYGFYQGDGTTCIDGTCHDEQETCVQLGACCHLDGRCDDTLEEDCNNSGGIFTGMGTRCATTDACFGACCGPDGECAFAPGPDCVASGGSYQGVQTFCDRTDCSTRGACCYADGSCTDDLTKSRCTHTDGHYAGDGSTCATLPDFDGDGLVDTCDPDIDNDGIINEYDVCDFTPPGTPVGPNGTYRADADRDCDVDLRDHAILQNEMTASGP